MHKYTNVHYELQKCIECLWKKKKDYKHILYWTVDKGLYSKYIVDHTSLNTFKLSMALFYNVQE